jgi:hypothetical protein
VAIHLWAVGMKRITLLVALTIVFSAQAAAPSTVPGEEISHLIGVLGSSGCQFNRNGTWYDAARAVSHLERKYAYLLKKDLVPDAEAFIKLAASQSSASGKPYLVKCGSLPEVRSEVWFREALEKFRSRSGEASAH